MNLKKEVAKQKESHPKWNPIAPRGYIRRMNTVMILVAPLSTNNRERGAIS